MAISNLVLRCGVGPTATIPYFVTHGLGGFNVVPPVTTLIIEGLTMIAVGLTILSGLTTNLDKGLVEDELNQIVR